MKKHSLRRPLIAAFALAGAMALSPVSQALAGETSVTLSNDFAATRAVNDATSPRAGDRLADGTIYAGSNFAATPSDAPGSYIWKDGRRYCENLSAHGHNDWSLPTMHQLDQLYDNKNTGRFPGTFNSNNDEIYYWSGTEHPRRSDGVWARRFSDGYEKWKWDEYVYSVRCVRSVAP